MLFNDLSLKRVLKLLKVCGIISFDWCNIFITETDIQNINAAPVRPITERKRHMKTKKLNRGLVLGGALLVGLAGFVTFDYFNFKSNKDEIKTTVEEYFDKCARASVSEDGDCREALEKVITDSWGYNSFYSKSYLSSYTTAEDITSGIDRYTDDEYKQGHLTDCTAIVSDLKVSKAGPNLAQADLDLTIRFKGIGQAHMLGYDDAYNTIFDSYNYTDHNVEIPTTSKVFDGLEYEGTIDYEGTVSVYLEYEGGEWKIVGVDGFCNYILELCDKDGEEIDLTEYANGSSGKSGDGKDSKGSEAGFKIKMPDGTLTDIPENASIADLNDLPEGAEIIRVGGAKGTDGKADESSPEKSGGEG